MHINEKLPQFVRICAFKNMLKLKTVTERGDNGNRYFDNTFSFSNEFRSVRPYFITLRDDLLIRQQYVYTCGDNGYQFRTAFSVCLTLKAFICQRKSQIMLRENTEEMLQKVASKNPPNQKNSAESWRQRTRTES